MKEEEPIQILKVLGLITNADEYHKMYSITKTEENISQKCGLKNINETRNYFIEKINQSELMSKKHKNVCEVSNYIEHLPILVSTVTRCVSISMFASLVRIPVDITSSAEGLNLLLILTAANLMLVSLGKILLGRLI